MYNAIHAHTHMYTSNQKLHPLAEPRFPLGVARFKVKIKSKINLTNIN